jgi:spore cortex biosynthesis protein YabQ
MEPLVDQIYSFTVTLFIGLTAGFCYDYYRVLKATLGLRKIGTHLGDLFFWLITTVVVFVLLLLLNSGEMRFYVLVGLGLGALVYFIFLSRTVTRLLSFKFLAIKKLYGLLLKIMALTWAIACFPCRLLLLLTSFFNVLAARVLRAGGNRARSAFYRLPGRRIAGAGHKARAWLSVLPFWRFWSKKKDG